MTEDGVFPAAEEAEIPGTPHRCNFDDDASQPTGNMVCMPPHVFAFCIVLSALASGVVVASRRIHDFMQEKLRRLLEPSRVHNPHLRRRSASHQLDRDSEGPLIIEAAKAMDRAAAAPLELEHKVPARYVRAFCGNEKHALERWKGTLKWRKENEIDSILNEPQPFFHDIRRYFPSYMSGRSRRGHIVVYDKLGGVNMRALRKIGVTVPMLLRHWIFVSEYQYRVLQPTDSAQQINIEDMAGMRIQSLAGKIQEYIKAVAHLARMHYVERCHKTFVVNAPAWFGLAFRVVSPFLSARTRQKIRILGSDLATLQDEIDPQFLPVEYGGTMKVPPSDSSDERKLRRLVDALNAKADLTNISKVKAGESRCGRSSASASNGSGSGGGGGGGGGRSRHPTSRSGSSSGSSRSPIKRGAEADEKPAAAAAQGFHRSPARDRQQNPAGSGRPTGPNGNPTPGRVSGTANPRLPVQSHGSLRATGAVVGAGGETGRSISAGGGRGLEESPGVSAAFDATTATAAGGRQDSDDERGERESGQRGRATPARPASRQDEERDGECGNGDSRRELVEEDDDALEIEDRLQAVMKDLGVPSEGQDRSVRRTGVPTRSELEADRGGADSRRNASLLAFSSRLTKGRTTLGIPPEPCLSPGDN